MSKLGPSEMRNRLDYSLWLPSEDFLPDPKVRAGERLSAPEVGDAIKDCEITWSELADGRRLLSSVREGEMVMRIPPDGSVSQQLDLDALLIKRASHRLLVVFHGALQRQKYSLPRFEFKRRLADFEGSVLFVGDPTLYAHENLGLGWYVGTERDNAHEIVATLVSRVQNALGAEALVLTGSSGGGFAAIAVGALIDTAVALAFSPQTSIERYYSNHRSRLVTAAFPSAIDDRKKLDKYAERFNLENVFMGQNITSKTIYVQNTADKFHILRHCYPFVEPLGMDVAQANFHTANFRLELVFMGDGHRPPPKDHFLSYVELAFRESSLSS